MTAHAGRAPAEGWLSRQIVARTQNFPRIVARIRNEPALIDALIEGLASKTSRVKFDSAKALWLLAEAAPELLYPRFDFFLALLDNDNSIVRWNAARVLACLAAVDADGKLEAALDKYLSPIPGPEMISAANAIQWASRIAIAMPRLADRIARAILGVRSANYKTAECRNVAIGRAIVSLDRFFHLIEDKGAVIAFVSEEADNSRPGTRRKAALFAKKRKTEDGRQSGDAWRHQKSGRVG